MRILKNCLAGLLFGAGLGMGFLPIALASLLMRENLFIVCIDCMDDYWLTKEQF